MADFWTNATLEPKRNFRWILTIGEMPNGAQFYAKDVMKPKLSIETSTHKYLNHTFKFPAGTTWEDVEVTLVDPVDPDAAQHVAAIIEAAGYIIPGNENQLTTMSKEEAVRALGRVSIRQFGAARGTSGAPGGTTTQPGSTGVISGDLSQAQEIWTLYNCWISNVDFGQLDYENEDLSEIKLTLTYDWAQLQTGGQVVNQDLQGKLDELGRNSTTERWRSGGDT